MAGGDLTHNVTHTNTNTTTVYNQDETKQVQTCAVSGRQAEIIKGNRCPSCGLWVHGDYFDHDTKLCTTCNSKKAKGAQQTFRDKVVEFLSDDQISKDEIQFLRDFGGRLNLSVAEQDNMIATVKKERVQNSSLPLSRIEKVRFDNAIKILLDENYEDVSRVGKLAAMRNLEALCERHPNNMEVAGSLVLAYMIAPMTGGEDLKQAEGRWAEKVQQRVRISPAFAHDTEGKFFYTCMAAGGLLLVDRVARHVRQHALAKMSQEQWEAFPEGQLIEAMTLHVDDYRIMDELHIEACSELEKAFPESDEWMCVELMLMFEEYFTNGHDPAIKSEILQVLPDTSGEITGDIGAVLQIVREKLLQDESFALLEKEKREGLSGYGQMIYYSLCCSFKDLAEDIQAQMGQADSHASGELRGAAEEKAEVDQDAVKEQVEETESLSDARIRIQTVLLSRMAQLDSNDQHHSYQPPPAATPPPIPGDPPPAATAPPIPGDSATPISITPSDNPHASIEKLQQIYDEAYRALETFDRCYTSGNIPSKKIKGAIKGYLPPEQAGNLQILYDGTVLGRAGRGLCFNGHTIYFKELTLDGKTVRLKDVESFGYKMDTHKSDGTINREGVLEIYMRDGTMEIKSFFPNPAPARAFAKFFQAALDLFRVIIV
ncbi:hypothetical protein N9986_02145 [Akkermansiaceae bacterium]|nr:hypothetical protein [Akkermansiaceae bacterium]